jgi:exodeoxyribonuclease V alpha subunit
MSERAPDPDRPEHALARAFAARVARWSRERGAPADSADAAGAAAYAASIALTSGHTCVPLEGIAGDSDAATLDARLSGSRVVGRIREGLAFPLVVDDARRLYLARYLDYETRLARALARRAKAPLRCAAPAAAAMLAQQFAADASHGQKLAAALALLRSLTIVSGGPGTGKTTTVVKFLACLLAADPETRIALTAPTGKAAARLQEAVANFKSTLAPAVGERLPGDVYTVHRLLGARADGHAFRHDADHPVPFDVVVVDEASMLDLALAARLVEAVPIGARLLLVGDKDQLSAVEAGAVFHEVSSTIAFTPACADALAALTGVRAPTHSAAARSSAGALTDSVVWLTDNFRFARDSGIGRVAAAVNAGDTREALAALRGGETSVRWIDDAGSAPAADTLAAVAGGYAEFVTALAASPIDRARAFDAFNRFRVLCAERRGPRGAQGINATLTERVRSVLEAAAHQSVAPAATAVDDAAWFVGRPVMVLANDHVQRLFNGDVGLALPDDDGALRVWFATPDGSYRAIAPARLPAHETAFATTVHKAQGSEFDDVLLVLPQAASRVVTRELVYTAITRARRSVTIAAAAATLEAAIDTPTRRASGLIDRLADAFSQPA